MEAPMKAIETVGIIDEDHHLQVEHTLPISGPKRVRVIILYSLDEEWDETEWLQAASHNSAFDFLSDPEEDIYSLADGKPFYDEA